MTCATKLALASTFLAASFNLVVAAELGAVNEPIKLAVNEWTGQHVTTRIAGRMLEAAGYKVEYVTAGYQNMWQAMSEGQLDAAVEVWGSNVTEQYKQMNKDGKIEDLGPLGLDARGGFFIRPTWPSSVPDFPLGRP